MTLLYAFSNRWSTNISARVLLELQKQIINNVVSPFPQREKRRSREGFKEWDFQKIYGHPQTFFHRFIDGKQYDLIIGLGDYYGHLDRIRVETQASNRYGDRSIYPFGPITLDLNLPNLGDLDSSIFKIGSDMGNYNCNWLAYKTQLYLNHKSPATHHLFFHLPKKSSPSVTATQIYSLLVSVADIPNSI